MQRAYTFLASGITALILNLTNAILLFVLAGALIHVPQQSHALIWVSSIFQILSCFTWSALLWRQYRLNTRFPSHHQYGLGKHDVLFMVLVGVLPSIIAAVVTGTALGWGEGNLPNNHIQIVGRSASVWLTVTFVIWGLNLASQAAHIIVTLWFQKPPNAPSRQRFSIDTMPQSMREINRPATAHTQRCNPFQEAENSSSPPTLVPSEGPSSFRSSFSTLRHVPSRPSSSKKTLLMRQHSYPRHSQRSSFETMSGRPSQEEGFDSWDTSQVSSQIRETILQSKPSIMKKPRPLAPIPGSRSPSPAKALEGPFFQPSPNESPPASPLPQPSVSRPNSPPSPTTEIPSFSNMFPPIKAHTPPTNSAPATPPELPKLQTAFPTGSFQNGISPLSSSPVLPIMRNIPRPMSTTSPITPAEGHIHPLFRTTSPSPAPSPSLGTIVTAAPEAGQLINEHALKRIRSRSGSLPSIRNTLIRSESSPEMRTRSIAVMTASDPPPVPRRSMSRPAPRSLHQRKRSVSFEDGFPGMSRP